MATRTISTRLALDGEKEFKQQMGLVNSELKTLASEMTLATAEFKGQANSAEYLTKKDEILRREIEQQTEKVEALRRAVDDSTEAYGDADKRTDGYKQSLNRAQAELLRLNDDLKDNSRYLDEARESADGCAKSIDEYGKEIDKANSHTSLFGTIVAANLTSDTIKDGIKGLGSAIATLPVDVVRELAEGFRAVYDTVTEMADAAGDIDDAAKRTGTTAEEYQKWAYAAKLGGMEVSKLESLMVKQQKSFADAREGVKATAEAYKRLGINIDETENASAAFDQVIAILADMEDETTRNALANDIFGKSYADLAPLLAEGSEGIAAWRQEIVDLGGVMSNEAVEAGANFGDSIDRLTTRFDGMKNYLAGEFVPAFTDIVDGVTDILGGDVDRGVNMLKLGMAKADAVMDRLGPMAEEALDMFLDEFIDHFPDIIDRGGDLILKLVEGIGDKGPDIISAVAEAVNTLVNKLLDPETLEKVGEAGIAIGEAILQGMGSILSNIGSRAWQEIKDAFGGNPYADNAGSWNHSHRSGLRRVPYDGYIAELHEDERVLTAREAQVYNALERYGAPAVGGVTANELRSTMAQAVNAMNGSERPVYVTVVSTMKVNGREFYSETLPDLRAVESASPALGGEA